MAVPVGLAGGAKPLTTEKKVNVMSTSNVSAVALAFAAISKGTAQVAKGTVALTEALVPLVRDGNLYRAGDVNFTLAEYHTAKVTKGMKFKAFCEAHGVPEGADQSKFSLALNASIGIAKGDLDVTIENGVIKEFPVRMCKGINLGTVDKPSAIAGKIGKNKLEGAKLQAAIDKETVIANGKAYWAGGKVATPSEALKALKAYAEDKGLIPAAASRNRARAIDADKARDAMSVINQAFTMIEKSDESPIAFTSKDEAALREMAQHIAAYFAK